LPLLLLLVLLALVLVVVASVIKVVLMNTLSNTRPSTCDIAAMMLGVGRSAASSDSTAGSRCSKGTREALMKAAPLVLLLLLLGLLLSSVGWPLLKLLLKLLPQLVVSLPGAAAPLLWLALRRTLALLLLLLVLLVLLVPTWLRVLELVLLMAELRVPEASANAL
jgi:hypothetical protein